MADRTEPLNIPVSRSEKQGTACNTPTYRTARLPRNAITAISVVKLCLPWERCTSCTNRHMFPTTNFCRNNYCRRQRPNVPEHTSVRVCKMKEIPIKRDEDGNLYADIGILPQGATSPQRDDSGFSQLVAPVVGS